MMLMKSGSDKKKKDDDYVVDEYVVDVDENIMVLMER